MKSYPTKIRITRKVSYRVVWVAKFEEEVYGETDKDAKTITIEMGLSPKKTKQTLIHEIFHAIEEEYGIAIPHFLIRLLEEPIYKLLTLNKWM